jgi:Ni,Fe-hydrogenase I small subunit
MPAFSCNTFPTDVDSLALREVAALYVERRVLVPATAAAHVLLTTWPAAVIPAAATSHRNKLSTLQLLHCTGCCGMLLAVIATWPHILYGILN